jgi:hypothetical protein
MEPRVSLSAYVAGLSACLVLLSLIGFEEASFGVSLGVVLYGLVLCATYLWQRRALSRMDTEYRDRRDFRHAPPHRVLLDKIVLGQIMTVALFGALGAWLLPALFDEPLHSLGYAFDVPIIAITVITAGLYCSALVDWYLILPKISGISSLAPCELAGRQRWVNVTGLWLFHRGFLRVLIPICVAGTFAVIALLSDNTVIRGANLVVGGLVLARFRDAEAQGLDALAVCWNSRRNVGDVLNIVRESGNDVELAPGYMLDVSAEGAKFKFMEPDGSYRGGYFVDKHDDDAEPVAVKKLNGRKPSAGTPAPCVDQCVGINWYCHKNPLAYSQSTSTTPSR